MRLADELNLTPESRWRWICPCCQRLAGDVYLFLWNLIKLIALITKLRFLKPTTARDKGNPHLLEASGTYLITKKSYF